MENKDKTARDRKNSFKLVAAGGASILASGLLEAGNNASENEDEKLASKNAEKNKMTE